MILEYYILHPVKDRHPYSGMFIGDIPEITQKYSWDDILSKLIKSIDIISDKGNKTQFICRCGCKLFIVGGFANYGICAVKCKDCDVEILLKYQSLKHNYHNSKPPFILFKPRSFKREKLMWQIFNYFHVGPVIELNGDKYNYPIEKYCSPMGEDFCCLYGNVDNMHLNILSLKFPDCESEHNFNIESSIKKIQLSLILNNENKIHRH